MSSKRKSEIEDDMKEVDVLEEGEVDPSTLSDDVRDNSEEEQALEEALVARVNISVKWTLRKYISAR